MSMHSRSLYDVLVRAAYAGDEDEWSDRTGIMFLDESRTQQSQKEEADINVIVKRFGVSGVLPQGIRVPSYGDFDSDLTFQKANDILVAGNQAFMLMPAEVRERFGNNAMKFMDFFDKADNWEEGRKLGLVLPEAKPEPEKIQKVEIYTPPGKEAKETK